MKAAIFVSAEYIGLLTSFAHVLEKNYDFDTVLIARDPIVKKNIDKILPGRVNDITLSEVAIIGDVNNVVQQALAIENKYNVKMSMLLSEDRALGQGYLSNVDRVPHIIRSNWPHEKKLSAIIGQFIKVEKAILEADIVINRWPDKIISTIAKYNGAKNLCLTSIRFGDRKFWSDDDYITGSKFINRIKENIEVEIDGQQVREYEIDPYTDKANSSLKFNYLGSIREGSRTVFNDTKNWIRWIQKKDSYQYLGWVPSVFRRVGNFKYVRNNSVKLSDVKKYKVIYMTLHLEPEVSMLFFSPEFSNSMEAIIWLSKSLPADTVLIVKEHPHSYGVRSRWYYKQINKISNVLWAHPDTNSFDWIERGDAVATITGTVAVEAVYMKKPVISFGAHQVVNYLPTAFYVNSFNECKKAVGKCLSGFDSRIFDHSIKALEKAQMDSSFELPGYAQSVKSRKLEVDMAEEAIANLFKEYGSDIGV
jgi:hypothetical protein